VRGELSVNKTLGDKKSLSALVEGLFTGVLKISPEILPEPSLASSKNGLTQLLLLSCVCFLYSLAAALSSLALSLAAFLTDAD
jgi:hypothetical protein